MDLQTRLSRLKARLPSLPRREKLASALEWTARIGYGARGFVFLSAGVLTLLAALDRVGSAVGSSGAAGWLAGQPFGRVWLLLLGVGLWAFVVWRALQAIFDVDHEGTDLKGWASRAGAALSGVFYGLLAATVFEYMDEYGPRPEAEDVAENQEKAATLLQMPFGEALLILLGLAILAMGIGNVVRAWKDDFTDSLACSEKLCRRLSPIARTGYAARGFAYLPLGLFVVLAGVRDTPEPVTTLGAALDALEAQPGGSLMLGLTAAGLIAFGVFAFVEARWRRMRPGRALPR